MTNQRLGGKSFQGGRQTVYGDITRELGWYARFSDIQLIDEAV